MHIQKITSTILAATGIIIFTIFLYDSIHSENETKSYIMDKCEITKLERVKVTKGSDKILLLYKYEVNGNIYKSDNFSNGVGNIADFESQYPNRIVYPVYYDPLNPEKSVLVLGGRKTFLNGAIIAGLIIFLFGLVGYFSDKVKLFSEIWNSFFG